MCSEHHYSCGCDVFDSCSSVGVGWTREVMYGGVSIHARYNGPEEIYRSTSCRLVACSRSLMERGAIIFFYPLLGSREV